MGSVILDLWDFTVGRTEIKLKKCLAGQILGTNLDFTQNR